MIDPRDARGRRKTSKVLIDKAVPTIFDPDNHVIRPVRKAPRKRSPSSPSPARAVMESAPPRQDHDAYTTKKPEPTTVEVDMDGSTEDQQQPSEVPFLHSFGEFSVEEQLKVCKKENKDLKAQLEEALAKLEKYQSRFKKEERDLIEGNVKKVKKWSDEALTEAMVLRHLCGTGGYNHMRKKLGYLPDISTLNNHLKEINIRPGVSKDCLKLLKLKAKKLTPMNKEAVLVIDEMSIQPRLEFDATNKCISGTVSLPNSDSEIPDGGKDFLTKFISIMTSVKLNLNFLKKSRKYQSFCCDRYAKEKHLCLNSFCFG